MNRPTLRALARLLAPWHTIRRLEKENQELSQALGDSAVELLTLHQRVSVLRPSRLRHCPTHGQQPDNAWGCPVCVRELRGEVLMKKLEANGLLAELATAKQENKSLRAELAAELALMYGEPPDPGAHY